MADLARKEQEKRTIQVNRTKLVQTLIDNREAHIEQYEEAIKGYHNTLLSKTKEAFAKAKIDLEKAYNKLLQKIENMQPSDIQKQRDSFTLVDYISVDMKVPRCYSNEYDAAIDMFSWDVRETIDLSFAEFNCFIRDEWDWKSTFETITLSYC